MLEWWTVVSEAEAPLRYRTLDAWFAYDGVGVRHRIEYALDVPDGYPWAYRVLCSLPFGDKQMWTATNVDHLPRCPACRLLAPD